MFHNGYYANEVAGDPIARDLARFGCGDGGGKTGAFARAPNPRLHILC